MTGQRRDAIGRSQVAAGQQAEAGRQPAAERSQVEAGRQPAAGRQDGAGRRRRVTSLVALWAGALVAAVLLCGVSYQVEVASNEAWQQEAAEAHTAALLASESFDGESFYQKLHDGRDVNILVVGDSIGAGSCSSDSDHAWDALLEAYLEATYGVEVTLTNISMGGNTSYAGYVRTNLLDDGIDYDVAIVCYGENDATEGFSTFYEAMYRAIKAKYPGCSLVAIQESSQRIYSRKMQAIESIAAYYGALVVDTIAPFASGEDGSYEELTADDLHPNDAGYAVYAREVEKVIDAAVEDYRGNYELEIAPMNVMVRDFENFRWIDASEFDREGSVFTYRVGAAGAEGAESTVGSGSVEAAGGATGAAGGATGAAGAATGAAGAEAIFAGSAAAAGENIDLSGVVGIYGLWEVGYNSDETCVDGELFSAHEVYQDSSRDQRTIWAVSTGHGGVGGEVNECVRGSAGEVADECIVVTFGTESAADGFEGLCVSWAD